MNFRIVGLACGLFFGAVGPALAQADCAEPIPPSQVDGSKATLKQIGDASHDSNVFMHQSDDYQACLISYLKQKQAEAAKSKTPFDDSIKSDINSKVHENQDLKIEVATEFQKSFVAFCQMNPGADPSCKKVVP